MLSVKDIVAELPTLTRAEFGEIFHQAQIGEPSNKRQEFEALTTTTEREQAFAEALSFAEAENWLDAFIAVAISKGLASGKLIADYGERAPGSVLHALIDPVRGYESPSQVNLGISEGMRITAKVLYDGAAQGTGILVRPDQVLTAWHVLQRAFRAVMKNGKTGYEPRKDAGPSIQFEFDDVLIYQGRNRPRHAGAVVLKAATDWHVCSSPCHREELVNRIPQQRDELVHFWDYVVVRLDSAPGLERRWADFDQRNVVPQEKEPIYILQHPNGQPLKLAGAEVGGPRDFSSDQHCPLARFVHFANGDSGSSGAPCFDKSFSLFGIHQGEWPYPPKRAPNGHDRANRGVPLIRIYEHLKEQIGGLPPPDPAQMSVWRLKDEQQLIPVIGREKFQTLLWRAALGEGPQVMVIKGEVGSGKSFLLRLLQHLLPDKMHLKIEIPAQSIVKAQARELVGILCTLAGADRSQLHSEQVNSTPAVERQAMVTQLVEALDRVRGGRKIWLLLQEINKSPFNTIAALDLLGLLCESAQSVPWLRIVLDGFEEDVPGKRGGEWTAYRAEALTEKEVATFFRRLDAEYRLGIGPAIAGVARNLIKQFGDDSRNTGKLVEAIAQQALAFVEAASTQDSRHV